MNGIITELTHLTDDCLNQIATDHECALWLDALFHAISTELKHSPALLEARIERVKALAGLGEYLANDLGNYTDTRARDLRQQLDNIQE